MTYNYGTLIKGETNDFDKFLKNLEVLGYGFNVEKSVKYENNLLITNFLYLFLFKMTNNLIQ